METKTNLIVQDAMKAVSSQVRLPECIRNGKIKNMKTTVLTAEELFNNYLKKINK